MLYFATEIRVELLTFKMNMKMENQVFFQCQSHAGSRIHVFRFVRKKFYQPARK